MEGIVPKLSIEVNPSEYYNLGLFWIGRGRALHLIQSRISTTGVKILRKRVRESRKTGRNAFFEKRKRYQAEGIFSLKE